MATDDLVERLAGFAIDCDRDDHCAAFIDARARIEALQAQLAGTNALIRDLAALPPGGEVWDRSKQLADFTLRARAIEAGPANP